MVPWPDTFSTPTQSGFFVLSGNKYRDNSGTVAVTASSYSQACTVLHVTCTNEDNVDPVLELE